MRSLYKSGGVLAVLIFIKLAGAGFFPLLIFFGVFLGLYISEPPERKMVAVSYWMLVFSSLFVLGDISKSFSLWIIPIILYMGAFWIFFSFVAFKFKSRALVHGIINTLGLFSLLLAIGIIFPSPASGWFLIALPLVFFCFFWLLRESFAFSSMFLGKRRDLISLALSLLGVELFWIFHFLPFGILNASAFIAITLSLVRDALLVYEEGKLNLGFVLRQITLFVVVFLAFSIASPWSI